MKFPKEDVPFLIGADGRLQLQNGLDTVFEANLQGIHGAFPPAGRVLP